MKVLFATAEAAPFVKAGGLADVMGSLPQALRKRVVGARVVLPLYDTIPANYREQMQYIGYTYVSVGWRSQYCGVFELTLDGVRFYFLDNEYYFKRGRIYGEYDDAERFAFFSRAVLDILPIIGFYPDVIHANDWHTALTPVYLDLLYRHIPEYAGIKTVFTIHNIAYQGRYGMELLGEIFGIPASAKQIVEYDGDINLMKGAIECADLVSTVSRTYAEEIVHYPYYAYGLHGILSARAHKVRGIVNGIDTELYNPATDTEIAANFTGAALEKKKENKKALCAFFGLEYQPERPIIAMVTRLTEHKGLDLVTSQLNNLLAGARALIILGNGEEAYESAFRRAEYEHRENCRAYIGFSAKVAKMIYAGADMFLMPSKSEPCGLSQLIAMRYGTVPIVRRTGGLADTVPPFNPESGEGRGFTFESYDSADMADAVYRACAAFADQKMWRQIMRTDMAADFSWKVSAAEYHAMYKEVAGMK